MIQRHRRKKQHVIWPILIVIILIFVGIGVYLGYGTLFGENQSGNNTSTLNASNPTKTSKEEGYISSSAKEAATGSMATVSDAGNAEWVKVPSTQKLEKFTDMSQNDLTVYRINNPKVLKTVTSLATPRKLMADVISEYPDSLIMNGSAFNMSTGQVVGLQINNGQLLNDWPVGTQVHYAFVINKDGSCKIYDSSTPASTIIKNGAAQSYDFGVALIRDGRTVPSDGSVNWEIHSFIANDKDNNLYVILSKTNAGYENIMSGVANLRLENMLLLDSGGSSQLSVRGKVIVPSQDNRAVPDYIVMK